MRPGQIKPSAVLDNYDDLDTASDALYEILDKLTPDQAHFLVNSLIPNFNMITIRYETFLVLAKKEGAPEPNPAPIHLNESQVAVTCLVLYAASLRTRDSLKRAEFRGMIGELSANLALSKEIIDNGQIVDQHGDS